MSTAAVEAPTAATPTPAVDPGAGGERHPAEAPTTEDAASRAEILKNLGLADDGDVTLEDIEAEEAGERAAKDKPDIAAAPEEDEDAKTIREINARSRERRNARKSREAARTPAATPAVTSAQAAVATADAAAKTTPAAAPAAEQPKNEVAQAVRDVLAQIERLAGEDEAATTAAAAGAEDKTKEARAAELTAIRETVAKIADGLKSTDDLKAQLDKVQSDLREQAETNYVRGVISSQVDAIAKELPTLAARRDAVDVVHHAAGRFFEKYKVAPDLRELARRIEKKLSATTPETKNGERAATPRKTVSTSHSSPPAARQGPDKRSGKEAEADLFKRLGVDD